MRARVYKDITGQKFGMLTAIKFVRKDSKLAKSRSYLWQFKCDCGKLILYARNPVISGHKASCGCIGNNRKIAFGESAFNSLFQSYKYGAKERGLEFSLTKEQFRSLTSLPCTYCDTLPSREHKPHKFSNGAYRYNGLDRVNNNKGYIISNVVTACKICNYAKKNISLEEFLDWIHRLQKV